MGAAASPADFGVADFVMFSRQMFADLGNCFQLKADFCIFGVSAVIAVPKDGNRHGAVGCCASPRQIFVQPMF
jgi:hypothetical protein